MSDFDALKASEGVNAEAWSEIGAFVIAGRPAVDEEPDPEDIEAINECGEVGELDPDDLPEGIVQCSVCSAVDSEDQMISGAYGYECEHCHFSEEPGEDESWNDPDNYDRWH
jgi:hypothetical protein